MSRRPSPEEISAKFSQLQDVHEVFPDTEDGFVYFAQVCIETLIPGKPKLTPLQEDVCRYLYSGKDYRAVEAMRGLGKTTLAAILAVFRIIHCPTTRVLIVSAGSTMAKEISNWVIQIFRGLEFLNFMLPDTSSGDRSSVESFDTHHILRGSEKSPSVKCLGITSSLQGSRADLLISDDRLQCRL